ncbi:MAG: imidazole glycerol phosphate synthase subunit HisH [Deltaproteobacteria bacterium]|nr:imidazole glycerol phosphate synthase subunit HisH [Deltaproteobacteria bacterium]
MIAIIDYGMGNLRSVKRGFDAVGAESIVSSDRGVIAKADRIVLPGVGAFADCMKNLKKLKLVNPILDAIGSKKPFLGICLGFQVLFEESEEFGRHRGLGVLQGRVVRFKLARKYKVPHMGWNRLLKKRRLPLLVDTPEGCYMYFVHSYHVVPKNSEIIVTTTDYGKEFCSSVAKNNIFACQFHPEKSQKTGLGLLKAFATFSSPSQR